MLKSLATSPAAYSDYLGGGEEALTLWMCTTFVCMMVVGRVLERDLRQDQDGVRGPRTGERSAQRMDQFFEPARRCRHEVPGDRARLLEAHDRANACWR